MTEQLRIAVIIGSTRAGRFGPRVADWFAAAARRRPELTVDLIDLALVALPEFSVEPSGPVAALGERLTTADGFAVVTPEYNRGIPAPLKNAIDWFDRPWRAKPVTVIAYGRESGGRYATDHLRQVFTELDAVTIRDTVGLPCFWNDFAPDGSWPKRGAACHTDLHRTLDQLTWWAHALREARRHHPLPED